MFTIPNPFFIILDDIGWFCGKDDRESGGPSRTAMPRRHCLDDYIAIHNFGKSIGMKINCGLVLCEWDFDNRLSTIPNLSKYGKSWNNAHYIDLDEVGKIVDVLNGSPYIDIAIHALSHGYYAPNVDYNDISDWYTYINKNLVMVDKTDIVTRLDAFYDLLNRYEITKKINSFIPPSGAYRCNELSNILKDYGIKYITNPFDCTESPPSPFVYIEESGIILSNRNKPVPWNSVSTDTSSLPPDGISVLDGNPIYGVFGLHWPNILHVDSKRNDEVIKQWVKYVKMCSKQFNTFISPDLEFASHQLLYLANAKTSIHNKNIIIDISNVPSRHDFCVNLRGCICETTGCKVSVFATNTEFTTYKIHPELDKIEIIVR